MRRAWALAVLLVGTTLAGCIGDDEGTSPNADLPGGTSNLPGPGAEVYERGGGFSYTLEPGIHEILPGEQVFLPSADGTMLDAGVFLPAIDGCDWSAPDLPDACKVPVVMDVGPYYSPDQDTPSTTPAERLGRFLIENLVAHGYAVVQASVRGTGLSDGCNDFLGPKERQDVDAFVTYFGTQPWSNGNVGLIGRSYDGTTPWEAATFGNPHLKTIVPISGLSDVGGMYYRNGSSEWRAPVLGTIYTSFGLDDGRSPEQMAAILCPETAIHPAFGTAGYLNGGGTTPAGETDYWAVRNYQPEVLANYEGSVWIIHGLQDWNVDPHMAFPFARQLQDAGLDLKVWAGQWQHNYPDRPNEHDHLRWDWAEVTLHWFDKYLKGMDVDTGPAIESEDNHGNWRTLDAWPPREVNWATLHLSGLDELSEEAGASSDWLITDPPGGDTLPCTTNDALPVPQGTCATFESEPFAAERHIVGLPRLHLSVTPTVPGGQLYAELFEVAGSEEFLIGHAQMDLRYHAGGTEPQVVVPGQTVTALMEFFPLDALVREGSTLKLVVRQSKLASQLEPLPSVPSGPVVLHTGEGSTLSLPLGEVGNVHYVSEGVDPNSTWD